MPKLPNYRRVKIYRSYTVEDIAHDFGIHKNTVRAWVKVGLPVSDDKRPMLILGSELAAYLKARRTKNKRPCRPGEIYCVRCRAPKRPGGDMAEYQPISDNSGNLVGICPDCETMLYRRVNMAELVQVRGNLEVTFTKAEEQVSDSTQPTVNSDFREGV
jgi:hypothetical protein